MFGGLNQKIRELELRLDKLEYKEPKNIYQLCSHNKYVKISDLYYLDKEYLLNKAHSYGFCLIKVEGPYFGLEKIDVVYTGEFFDYLVNHDYWVPEKDYKVGSIVCFARQIYKCKKRHTSSSCIKDDLDNWLYLGSY